MISIAAVINKLGRKVYLTGYIFFQVSFALISSIAIRTYKLHNRVTL